MIITRGAPGLAAIAVVTSITGVPSEQAAAPARATVDPGIEQTAPGSRPPLPILASFDGLGFGFTGPQSTAQSPVPRNPSDNTIAVGPDHIVQIVNSQLAVFT
jgi:hypothetical protein